MFASKRLLSLSSTAYIETLVQTRTITKRIYVCEQIGNMINILNQSILDCFTFTNVKQVSAHDLTLSLSNNHCHVSIL